MDERLTDPSLPAPTLVSGRRWRILLLIAVIIAGLVSIITVQQRLVKAMIGMKPGEDTLRPAIPVSNYPYPWQAKQREKLERVLRGSPDIWDTQEATFAINILTTEDAIKTEAFSPALEATLRACEKEDRQNAFYPYLLASVMYRAAVTEKHDKDPITGKTRITRTISDRKLLDRAMAELRVGTKRPRFQAYHYELLNMQFAAMQPASQWEDYVLRLQLNSSILMPEYARARQMTRVLPWYAELLASEGRTAEALAVLDYWRPMAQHVTQDSQTLISILVVGSILQTVEQTFPEAYSKAGHRELGERARLDAVRIYRTVAALKASKDSTWGKTLDVRLEREGGMLPGIFLPVVGNLPPPSDAQLTVTRHLDYVLADERQLVFFVPVVFSVIIYFALVALRWRREVPLGQRREVFLTSRQWMGIFAATLLPLALYAIYTRITPWSGREVNIMHNDLRAGLEWTVVLLCSLVLPLFLARRAARRQWLVVSQDAPSATQDRRFRLTGGLAAVVWSLLFATAIFSGILITLYKEPATLLFHHLVPKNGEFLGVILVFAAYIMLMLLPYPWEKSRLQWSPYFHAMAQTLIPVSVAVLFLLTCVCFPLLRYEERQLLARDELIFFHNTPATSYTPFEAKITRAAREEMLATMNAIETSASR